MTTNYAYCDLTEIVDLVKEAYDKMGKVLDRDDFGYIDADAPYELKEAYYKLQDAYSILSEY